MLDKDAVRHIAELAHIRLDADELEAFQRQLSSILDYVGQLSQVDVKGVEPAAHISGVSNVLRDDAVRPSDPAVRQALLEAAPEREGDLIKVKAVFQ